MGKQSARIYFQGKDHKEIYYQGHYHDAMYIGNTLVWEKLKAEEPIEKVPLEGFSAICYYNGFYYVVCCETKPMGTYLEDTLIMTIYQGESLNRLEFAYTISSINFAYTNPTLVTADKNGLTLAYYDGKNSLIKLYYVYHFEYLQDRKIDIKSVGKGYDKVILPIHIPVGSNICFLKDFYLGNAAKECLSNDAENLSIRSDIFFWNDKIICPLYYNAGYQKISEPYYIYFGTDDYNSGSRGNVLNEIRKIKIPVTICSIIYDAVRERAKNDDYLEMDKMTPETVYMECTGACERHCYISDRYLYVPSIHICAAYKIYNNYYYKSDIYCNCVIDLENFDFLFFQECQLDYGINRLAFMMDKYNIGFNKTIGVDYLWWDYDGSYYHKRIDFSEIENVSEIEDSVSASDTIRISSCYYLNKKLYASLYYIDNYLLQIDTVNNTASVIKPQLYLEEE